MIRREVILSPEPNANLLALYDWIAIQASPDIALGYIERLEKYVRGFDVASERGEGRDDVRKGLRTVGFERRVTIAFSVADNRVTTLGFFTVDRTGRKPFQNIKCSAVAGHRILLPRYCRNNCDGSLDHDAT